MLTYPENGQMPKRAMPLNSWAMLALVGLIVSLYVEEIDEGGGGPGQPRRKYREYIVSKEHEGKWKKRLDKEDKEMIELIIALTRTFD